MIERKDGSRPEPPPRPERYNQIRTASARPTPPTNNSNSSIHNNNNNSSNNNNNNNNNNNININVPASKNTSTPSPAPSAAAVPVAPAAPASSTSKLDLSANPPYNGTPINKISMESDLLPSEKPWRKPGADVTDYFNYGFDEFTWTAYCQKQEGLREEFSPQKIMEQMMLMSGMGMGMMPGMDSSMGDMSGMMGGGFGMQQGQQGPGGSGGGPPQGSAGQAGAQGMEMMGDQSMYMGGQGFDGRGAQDGAYGMGRGGMQVSLSTTQNLLLTIHRPPQGPAAGPMGAYGGYDQGMMQGARGPGAFVPRGRGGRRW